MSTYVLNIVELTSDQIRLVADVLDRKGASFEEYEKMGIRPIIEDGGEDVHGKYPDRLIGFESF